MRKVVGGPCRRAIDIFPPEDLEKKAGALKCLDDRRGSDVRFSFLRSSPLSRQCSAGSGRLPTSPGQAQKPPNWGIRKPVFFETLRQEFAEPAKIYAPFFFWFWDEPLNPVKMAAMAKTLANQGFNPGYTHARLHVQK